MKHAYMIIAHKYDDTFKTLLRLIDYEENDIFLHMDIKNKDFNEDEVRANLKYSKIYLTERTDVYWGGYAQINAEILLLSLATKTGSYKYYHLISGQDLPIKSQKYIHNYLDEKDVEYLEVVKDEPIDEYRVRYFHFISKNKDVVSNIKADRKLQAWQEKYGIVRNKDLDVRKGSNWFSITDLLARYIVNNIHWIKKHFKYTLCADELFLQTLICKSDFKLKLNKENKCDNYSGNFREIDWSRGNGMNPYIYTIEDFDLLKNSSNFFARKFDCKVDMEIIKKIEDLCLK